MSRYTHILFDHDGVLVDTEPLYYRATQCCIEPLGVDLEIGEYLRLMADGASPWELARPLGATDEDIERQRDQRNALYQEMLLAEPIEIDGVVDVLAELEGQYGLAIVTTAKTADFELIHRDRGIVPFMDFVLTRSDYERSKPHPDPYLCALRRFSVPASAAIVVEDSERGLKAAVAAGIDCAAVYHPFTAPQDFSKASYRIETLRHLITDVLEGS